MAVREDLVIDWGLSPRIVGVTSLITELTVQDLYDTIRYLAAQPAAMGEPEILEGSGKEFLGTGTYVGLTIKLFNAKVKFKDRTGLPWVLCDIFGGNVVAVDIYNQPMDPREPAAWVSPGRTSAVSGVIMVNDHLVIADAVWDEVLADHVQAGSLGEKIKKSLTRDDFVGLK